MCPMRPATNRPRGATTATPAPHLGGLPTPTLGQTPAIRSPAYLPSDTASPQPPDPAIATLATTSQPAYPPSSTLRSTYPPTRTSEDVPAPTPTKPHFTDPTPSTSGTKPKQDEPRSVLEGTVATTSKSAVDPTTTKQKLPLETQQRLRQQEVEAMDTRNHQINQQTVAVTHQGQQSSPSHPCQLSPAHAVLPAHPDPPPKTIDKTRLERLPFTIRNSCRQ
ncbi:hypothetical protein E2C01_034277 [Portunus trituberculatus]|uniref:Uncharacterized protein n=1 Tax=Portunus trituberculatus TaxID=210409 RepID=A0A5B7F177_PORTR|nr:hypothetical protein [Portunus trituberculatus]